VDVIYCDQFGDVIYSNPSWPSYDDWIGDSVFFIPGSS
jgi:hypothetical protein